MNEGCKIMNGFGKVAPACIIWSPFLLPFSIRIFSFPLLSPLSIYSWERETRDYFASLWSSSPNLGFEVERKKKEGDGNKEGKEMRRKEKVYFLMSFFSSKITFFASSSFYVSNFRKKKIREKERREEREKRKKEREKDVDGGGEPQRLT